MHDHYLLNQSSSESSGKHLIALGVTGRPPDVHELERTSIYHLFSMTKSLGLEDHILTGYRPFRTHLDVMR